MRKIVIAPNDSGQRLDRLIGKWLPKATWSEIQKWIRKKYIKINGKRVTNARLFVYEGDAVEVFLSDATFQALSGSEQESAIRDIFDITPWIVAETEDYLVVNKPAGVLSHPAEAGIPDLTTSVQQYLGIEENTRFRPSAVGRLDRNTTGLMVFAKNYAFQKKLAEASRSQEVERKYLAVVHGNLEVRAGVIEGYVRKDSKTNQVVFQSLANCSQWSDPIDRGGIMAEESTDSDSVYAKTKYRVLGCYCEPDCETEVYSLVELELVTGRSHQIRVGLASIGHPIVGDPKYGDISGFALGRLTSTRRKISGQIDLKARDVQNSLPKAQLLHCWHLAFLGHVIEVPSGDMEAFLRARRSI